MIDQVRSLWDSTLTRYLTINPVLSVQMSVWTSPISLQFWLRTSLQRCLSYLLWICPELYRWWAMLKVSVSHRPRNHAITVVKWEKIFNPDYLGKLINHLDKMMRNHLEILQMQEIHHHQQIIHYCCRGVMQCRLVNETTHHRVVFISESKLT